MIPAGTDRKWKNLIYHIQLERFYIMCHHDPHFLKSEIYIYTSGSIYFLRSLV